MKDVKIFKDKNGELFVLHQHYGDFIRMNWDSRLEMYKCSICRTIISEELVMDML